MSWPLPQDFNEAIQNPRSAFSDPCLKAGEPVIGPQGLPLPRSGNFADVYQIRAADGKDWAAKCFTRPVTGLELRYAKVQEALDRAALPFTVAFTYLPEGVCVRGEWRPLLKMEWVEGLLLNQVVREQAGSPKVLDALSQMWSRLAKRLREAKIAHADLQHGNVLLVPGHKSGAYGLKLIDYDGIYAPPLANMPSGEAGHPNYQHPDRATKRVYSPDLDRFPHLVIATALKGLAVLGEALWDRYDTGDNLLFTEGDFRAPRSSKLMQELWQSGHPELQSLVGHLAISCFRPIPQSPWLDQIAPDGVATPLSQEQTAAAEVALGLVPLVATVVSAPIAAPVAHEALVELEILSADLPTAPASLGFTFDAEPAKISGPTHRPSPRKPVKSGGLGAGLIAGLVGLIVLVGVLLGAGAFLLGGKKPGEEITQAPIDPSPPSPTEKDSSKPPHEAAAPTVEPIKPTPEPVNLPAAPSPMGAVLPNRWDQTISTTGLTAIAFTADSAHLVALSARIPEVVVLDALNGGEVGRFTDHTNPPIGVCRLADGNIATMTTEEPFAIVWNPKTQRALGKLTVVAVPKGTPPAVFQVSLDARYAVTGRAGAPRPLSASGDKPATPTGKLTVTMTDTGRVVTTIDFVSGVVRFSPDGARLLVAEDRGRVRSFRLPAGTPEADWTVPASEHPSAALTIAGDGHWVAYWTSLAATAPSRLTVIDALTGKPVATGPVVTVAKMGGASSPDGRWLAANQSSGPRGRSFKVVEAMTGEVVATAPLPDTHNFGWDGTVEFSPDRFTLAVIRPGGAIRAFRVSRDLIAAKPKIPNDMGLSPPSPPTENKGPMPMATVPTKGPTPMATVPTKGPTPMATVSTKGPTPMATGRLAVPDDAAVAKADEKVRGLLKEDFAKKLSTDRKALVTKLLGLAEGASNDPAERFAMLRDARDLAAEAGDPIMAIQVVEVLGRSFRVNEHHLKIEPLEKVTAGTNSATILRAVADQALTGSEEASAADDYESAIKLAQVAGAAARRGSLLGGLAEEAELRVSQAKKGAEAFAVVRSALEKLQTEPNDPDANLAVGRYRCLSRGQWDEGLKHLAKGSHPDFKAAAAEELSAMQDGTPSVKVADRWWSLALILPAEERRPIEARARYWYLRALPVLTGLAKVEAEKRTWLTVNTIEYRPGLIAEFTAKPPAVLKGPKVRLDPTIDFSAAEFAERSQANTEIQVKWTGVIVANRPGRYRLVAETRDSVRLKINGKIIFETFTNKRTKPDGMVSVGDRPLAVQVEFASLNATPHHLKLKWVAPGSDIEEIIPPDALYHDRKAEGILGK